MDLTEIINQVYKFYPKNVTAFEEPYYSTDEYKYQLLTTSNRRSEKWMTFLFEIRDLFYAHDRSDHEPSNRIVINILKDTHGFEMVIHISLLVNYYSFYAKKYRWDKASGRSTFLEKINNDVFPEIEPEWKIILDKLKTHYPDYQIMPEEYSKVSLLDISTVNQDLGEVTIHHAVFAHCEI